MLEECGGFHRRLLLRQIFLKLARYVVDGHLELGENPESVAVTVSQGSEHKVLAGDHRRVEMLCLVVGCLKNRSELL